ncbi:MAG: DUF1570 domain-containing protein [Planctomycetaceae bacterium]|nr:DUF1570 domain-containing protein [Planctomycetaceae bacterium]
MIGNTSYVSTIAHEATHQIAFNSGMHTRYADNPIWLTEGMAMFFELPDLHSRSGWRTMGRVNPSRMLRFRDSLTTERMLDSLSSLTADDARFQNPENIEAAYAEAWLFTHFLIHSHRREYMAYLRICSEHTPLNWKTREERLREFEEAFGHSPMNFESQLRQYAAKQGPR